MSWTFAMRDGDFVQQDNGQPLTLTAQNKVRQDLVHVLMHPYNPATGYGNELEGKRVVVERSLAAPMVERYVTVAAQRLIAKQGRLVGHLPKSEKIKRIKAVVAKQRHLSVDYAVVVEVEDRNAEPIGAAFSIRNGHLFPEDRQ